MAERGWGSDTVTGEAWTQDRHRTQEQTPRESAKLQTPDKTEEKSQ